MRIVEFIMAVVLLLVIVLHCGLLGQAAGATRALAAWSAATVRRLWRLLAHGRWALLMHVASVLPERNACCGRACIRAGVLRGERALPRSSAKGKRLGLHCNSRGG